MIFNLHFTPHKVRSFKVIYRCEESSSFEVAPIASSHFSLVRITSTPFVYIQMPDDVLEVGGKSSYSEFDGDLRRVFQTYMLFNGLSVDTDPVLGDYTVWTEGGEPGVEYAIAVRLGGNLVREEQGVADSEGRSPEFTVTVTDYYDSDCTLKLHGEKS